INSLDITTRAVAKVGAHRDLEADLLAQIEGADDMPGQYRGELSNTVQLAMALADEVGTSGNQTMARKASSAVYNAATATLLATEGATLGGRGGDARRLLLSRMVLDHRMRPQDPLSVGEGAFDARATDLLLSDAPVSLDDASAALTL
ncbi:MAG: DNA alkylation response protein, partial [Pseudomonadota bacterium]